MKGGNFGSALDGSVRLASSCGKGPCCGSCGNYAAKEKFALMTLPEGPTDERIRGGVNLANSKKSEVVRGVRLNSTLDAGLTYSSSRMLSPVDSMTNKSDAGELLNLARNVLTTYEKGDERRVFWYTISESVRTGELQSKGSLRTLRSGVVIVGPRGVLRERLGERSLSSYGVEKGSQSRVVGQHRTNSVQLSDGEVENLGYGSTGSVLHSKGYCEQKCNTAGGIGADDVTWHRRIGGSIDSIMMYIKQHKCTARSVGVTLAVVHLVSDVILLALGTCAVVGAGAAIADNGAKQTRERKLEATGGSYAVPVVFHNGCAGGMRAERNRGTNMQKSAAVDGFGSYDGEDVSQPSSTIRVGSIVRLCRGFVLRGQSGARA